MSGLDGMLMLPDAMATSLGNFALNKTPRGRWRVWRQFLKYVQKRYFTKEITYAYTQVRKCRLFAGMRSE
jgi:hypothetical protein